MTCFDWKNGTDMAHTKGYITQSLFCPLVPRRTPCTQRTGIGDRASLYSSANQSRYHLGVTGEADERPYNVLTCGEATETSRKTRSLGGKD